MANRSLLFMTIAFIACIGLLLVSNFLPLIWPPAQTDTYLSLNDVRGIEIVHNHIPYTLNFEQQNAVIDLLNRSIPVESNLLNKKEDNLNIEKITIYPFGKPELNLTAYGYIDENLIFMSPEWNAKGLMKDTSNGELKKILSQTYDAP